MKTDKAKFNEVKPTVWGGSPCFIALAEIVNDYKSARMVNMVGSILADARMQYKSLRDSNLPLDVKLIMFQYTRQHFKLRVDSVQARIPNRDILFTHLHCCLAAIYRESLWSMGMVAV